MQHSFHSNFEFLQLDFPILANLCTSSEYHLYADPVISLIKLRQFGERITDIIFKEHGLEFPYDNTFHNRIKILEEEKILPERLKDLLFSIKNKGNAAVHESKGSIEEAKTIVFSAFKVSKWFAETYSSDLDVKEIKFSLPPNLDTRHALHLVEKEYSELEEKFNKLLTERKIEELSNEKKKEIRKKSEKAARKIDLNEAETRLLIDDQLKQAGWEVDTINLNFKIKGTLPDKRKSIAIAEWPTKNGWADYALFIGKDLYGFAEAKKYAQDISSDLTQSKRYAETVEEKNEANLIGKWRNYKVPFLFSTNGRPYLEQIKTKSGIWFLDVRKETNQSKPLQGWYSPEGLKKLFQQDIEEAIDKLKSDDINYLTNVSGLNLRDYQINAIKKVEEFILGDHPNKKALLAMATGTGKTRTVIGLCYRLIKANRFKRILFLIDRTILAIQAINSFKDNKIEDLMTLADTYQVEELKGLIPDIDTRLHFATVQGMVKRLFYNDDNSSLPSVDTYDCIIVDEAHRGYLLDRELEEDDLEFKNQQDYVSKYRMVLDYFDAYSIGLTATPALHTIDIFGKPVYSYSYSEAVIDGWLVDHDPPFIIKTKLSTEGIKWEKGEKPKVYDKESNKILELDELEDELKIDIEGFNKLVITENFNRTVCQQLVKELVPDGEEKTLIFAARDDHADLIVQLLNEEFEKIGVEVGDDVIVKITGKSDKPQQLVKRFKNEKYPNIAVTVDLLSTGVDVPPICNLVFLRRIKSRILYEQMLGRATRKCDEIGKEKFRIFDAVSIYETLQEYSNMKPIVVNPNATFQQLSEELDLIDNNERAKKQLDQIIAKLQRKKNKITNDNEEKFKHLAEGKDPESFINMLKEWDTKEGVENIIKMTGLWKFLDEIKPIPYMQFVSEHEDKHLFTARGYGHGVKPDDYIESFRRYIEENKNKITALNIICTKPKELDRKSLKELRLLLSESGFTEYILNTAWKESKNVEIAADIISYIRTLSLGSNLISHYDRIFNAMNEIRKTKDWNKVQLKWLSRFEEQLLSETVLTKEDLNKPPFSYDGGYKRLNKIFEKKLDDLLKEINNNLYADIA